jgi:hypothetical protein
MFALHQSQDTPLAASRALVGDRTRAMSSYPCGR